MLYNIDSIIKAIDEAKNKAKKRRFTQSVDLILKFRDLDLKKPENRINIAIPLPNPIPNKSCKVCVIASGAMILKARDAGADAVLTKEDIEKLSGNKKEVRKLAKTYDFFVATPDLMVLIGRVMGPILGPRGKMPEVVPPTADVKPVIEKLRRSVRVRVRDQPQAMTRVGSEVMESKLIAENVVAIIDELLKKLKPEQIEKAKVKLTMGPPVEIEELFT